MKKLALCLITLLLTSSSFCQTVTQTRPQLNADSVVCIPIQWARYLIQDVIHGDAAKEEVKILNESIQKQNEYILKQDTIVSIYRKRIVLYEETGKEHDRIDSLNQKSIETLKSGYSKIKRQRNAVGLFAIASVILGFILH